MSDATGHREPLLPVPHRVDHGGAGALSLAEVTR